MQEEAKTREKGISPDNVYAVLAYLWILCLVPVLMKKEDDFVKFHTRQGLALFIVEIAIGILAIIPFIGPIIYLLGYILCGVLSIAGIVQVLRGNMWRMPLIGDLSRKLNI
ncbi:MAG: hypothetical protein GF392_00800 [Candidatus Omnitrophica bacterium]|nr:hypothetical protein [Candidatus Omnitrophota bacterium]